MAPTPQNHAPYITVPPQKDGDRIVISGMAGLYPQSHNVKEFHEILYNKMNPVIHKDLRYKCNHPEVAQQAGSIPDIGYFDAQFFKVHFRLATAMDPKGKKLLEQSYQAIYDAGINPSQLSGKKVGVYIGSCFSETEKAYIDDARLRSAFGLTGCSYKAMFANRISYWLNSTSPSMVIDEACCSSTAALEQAYLAISRGECESAIVGGTFLNLHPQSSVHYGRIIKLCNDGKTKSFDECADGCAISEAINVLFLQKAKDASRIYAELLHVQTEFTSILQPENDLKCGFYRDLSRTTNFLQNFYKKAKVDPHDIEYVEAFGSASLQADKVELQAIEEVFCKNRDGPLLIGSVMSNIGYAEAASGISAITKVLLGYHSGQLAANLHCEQPRKDIASLCDGRMRVIRKHQQFDRGYVAVNGMSYSGVNSHVLLRGCHIHKNLNRYKSNVPYLVTISGMDEEAVKYVLAVLKSNPIDPEQLALLHNIHRTNISGHLGRGFVILQTDEAKKNVTLREKVDYCDDSSRPLWFVYSGMGSQWAGMGTQLMRIPIFAAAIERCRKVLQPKGVDIVNIITSDDKDIFSNITHAFVGIAAIQIGLTDILHELGLTPDRIIGHSAGELGCAYADGCLTVEETVLSAYYRGLVSVEVEFIPGALAAVGIGYKEISKLCPPEIVVACHNGPESSTLSGPSNVMRDFIATLTANGIFAKEIPCSNIAYHSHYVAHAGPKLIEYLEGAISTPKARSERWLSTSVPKDKWNEPEAKFCSAEYLTNNLVNPVLFEEILQMVPENAVLVEIAPHGLLQAILTRSISTDCTNIPLTRRNHPDNTVFLLEAIGQLYTEGYNPDVQVLYPKVDLPVSTGTPFLSHLVKWARGQEWPITRYNSANRKIAASCDFVLSLHDKEHNYLRGHSVRGNILYPFAASLTLAWDVLAMMLKVPRKQLSVVFDKLRLYSQPVLHDRRQLKLSVTIQRGTGYFEILDDKSKVMTGFISPNSEGLKNLQINAKKEIMYFNTEDIYQLLRDKGYLYSDEFRSIACIDESLSDASLVWRANWTTFIDGILQLNALRQPSHAFSQPISIQQIIIDVQAHNDEILHSSTSNSTILLRAKVSDLYDNTRCGGVTVQTIRFEELPLCTDVMAIKSLNFVSHFNTGIDVFSSLEVYFQMVAESLNKNIITAAGVRDPAKEVMPMFKEMSNVLKNMFCIKVNYKQVTREMALKNYKFEDVDLILVENLSTDKIVQQYLQEILPRDKFLVSEESARLTRPSEDSSPYRVLSIHTSNRLTTLQLIRWGSATAITDTTVSIPTGEEPDFDSLTSVHTNLIASRRLLGKWGGEYFLSVNPSTIRSQTVTLQGAQFGDYDSLKWVNTPALNGSEVIVNVCFAGINNNDVKQANNSMLLKQCDTNMLYGMDFSGITNSGNPVMGIVRSGAASTQVRAQPELLWPVPAHWSLEEAATVPLAYAQAFYCLGVKVKLPRGKSVFVHGGAGALGQAIISIALALDCEVFTTVRDKSKKHFLQKLFPALKADHIGCSRDHTFNDMVKLVSKGKKCDVVISCVKGTLKDMTFDCNAPRGIFLDISRIQDGEYYTLGMFLLDYDTSYVSVDFSSIFQAKNREVRNTIHKMISEGITRGYVRPLSRVTYAPHEAARAFRLLAASAHRGRVLLRMKENTVQAHTRITCSAGCSNLILCGKSTFGLHFADRLVARGARQLYLHIQIQSSYFQHKIRSWQRLGVNVVVSSESLDADNAVISLLPNCLVLGPLEGVFIVAEQTTTCQNLIRSLDTEIRKLSYDLRHFAVINFGDSSTGEYVCLNRLSDRLPATVLMLPEVNYDSYSTYKNWQGVVDAAEHALLSIQGVALAHEIKYKTSLLQQIAKLADITIPDGASKRLTLQELGIQNHKLQLLCTFLRVQHNLAFDEEQVLSLTINTIMETENKLVEFPCEDIKGLSTFFSYIGSNELLATTETVSLPTFVNSASMRADEFEPNQIKLCIVPGMEGHHERFRVLCERLKLPALALQPGLDHPHETVVETAQRFAEVMLNKIGIKETFYLLGYESGIITALEIAAILEDHGSVFLPFTLDKEPAMLQKHIGLSGKIFCIGCSPEELVKELEDQLSPFQDDKQLQDGILQHIYSLMTGGDSTVLVYELQNLSTWSQKIDMCVRNLLGLVSHTAQYVRLLIECALARIKQFRHYSIALRPLRSQVILLRAAMGHAPLQHTSLQHVSQQPLVVYQLDSPLAHITTDLRCTTIINEHLDPAILENVAMKNICNSYLLNNGAFMTLQIDEQLE